MMLSKTLVLYFEIYWRPFPAKKNFGRGNVLSDNFGSAQSLNDINTN